MKSTLKKERTQIIFLELFIVLKINWLFRSVSVVDKNASCSKCSIVKLKRVIPHSVIIKLYNNMWGKRKQIMHDHCQSRVGSFSSL